MPIAMTQEQRALQASLRDWAKRADTLAVVRSLEPGKPPHHTAAVAAQLNELAALGVFAIPLDGGTVTDLAAALEQLAGALAPGPVLPTALASLLLTRSGGQENLLPALAQARATACVALAPGTLTGTRQADGALRVTGETGPRPVDRRPPARPRRHRRRRRVVPHRPRGPPGCHGHQAHPARFLTRAGRRPAR